MIKKQGSLDVKEPQATIYEYVKLRNQRPQECSTAFAPISP